MKDMNPNLDPDELIKTHPSAIDRVLTDWVMPAFMKVGVMYSPIPNNDRLKSYGLRSIHQGISVKVLVRAIEKLPDLFERFPSFTEFNAFVRSQVRSSDIKPIERNPWPEQIAKVTDELVATHGRDMMEKAARAWFKGVFGSEPASLGLFSQGEVMKWVLWIFVHDRLQAPKGSTMPELIEWSKRDLERAQRTARGKVEAEIDRVKSHQKR